MEVSERTCIGSGICMSSCPKKGIDVKHYKLEYFSEMVKAAMDSGNDEPMIIKDMTEELSSLEPGPYRQNP